MRSESNPPAPSDWNAVKNDSQYRMFGMVIRNFRAETLHTLTTPQGRRLTVTVAIGTQSVSAMSGHGGSSAAQRHFWITSAPIDNTRVGRLQHLRLDLIVVRAAASDGVAADASFAAIAQS